MKHFMLKHFMFCILLNMVFVPFASAQNYPNKPIHFICPYPPGGIGDVVTRIVAGKLALGLGQQVIVENKPGAEGTVGMAGVARSAPDGYTIGAANNGPLAISASLSKALPYDPVKDFAAVSMLVSFPYFVMIRPSLPVQSMKELVEWTRANPGKLNFATAGNVTRLGGALMKSMAGMQMAEIPFNGIGPALTSLLGGHVDILMTSPMPKGALRALAVTSTKRFPLTPTLPTVAESAIPGYDVTAWLGVVAPAGTPREIVVKLSSEMAALLKMDDVREQLAAAQVEVVGSTPDELAAVIKQEVAKWAKVVKDSGMKVE